MASEPAEPKIISDIKPQARDLAFSNGGKSINELVHGLFRPTEYVVIKNIASVPVQWSYMPATDGEEEERDGSFRVMIGRRGFNEDRTMFIPGKERYKMLEAGESGIILGEGAYIAIENIYKIWKMEEHERETEKRRKNSKNPDINGAAPSFQDFLDIAKNRILVQKVSPESMLR